MSGWLLDLRYRVRNLARRPAFTAAVVATLALGIGLAGALFSIVDGLLLDPLPYPEPERLVLVWETVSRERLERREFSYPDFRDLAESATSFSGLAAFADRGAILTGGDRAERVGGRLVTPDYFRVLGAEPALGRGFLVPREPAGAADDDPIDVVLSHGLWRRLFAGDPAVLGRSLTANGRPVVVVGIMPPDFRDLGAEVDLWAPLPSSLDARGSRFLDVIGRLAPGVGLAAARLETEAIFARLEREYPDSNRGYGGTVVGLGDDLFGGFRRPLVLLAGAVALLMLVASANAANLLLMRATARRREAAVQAAMGMSRGRRLVQNLAEGLLLGVAGGGLGLLLALWALDAFRALNPVELPDFVTLGVDGRVAAFTFLVAVATGLALALVESALGGDRRLSASLAEGGRAGAGPAGSRLRRALVVAEVALTLVLAVGTVLMTRSLARMWQVDSGLDAGGLLAARFDLPGPASDEEALARANEILEAARRLPGVEDAALASDLPVDRGFSATLARLEGQELDPGLTYGGLIRIYRHQVSSGFFAALGIPLLAGRGFDFTDTAERPGVVVVSRAFAERHLPGEDPVGRRLQLGRDPEAPFYTIVGVAQDVRYRTLLPDPLLPEDPDVYFPLAQVPESRLALAVRSSLPPAALADVLRREVERLSPGTPLYEVATFEERVGDQLARERFSTSLLGLFAVLTALLAGVGIYSVMAYLVVQRRHEIGVRMALGARPGSVLGMVLKEGMGLAAGGVALGLPLALAASRLLAASLYEVRPGDPLSYAAMTAFLAALALAACLLPARRASRVDPALVLRGQ